jgi:hypothetical protein
MDRLMVSTVSIHREAFGFPYSDPELRLKLEL